MADLAEILILEHLAIRHIRRAFYTVRDLEPFEEFHNYLKECHIEVEEKILFPMLKSFSWDDSQAFNFRADQIKADHKLIDTLSVNLVKWHNQGDLKLFEERFPLYFKLMLEHNEREEELIFPRWKLLPADELKSTVKEAANIIDSFGTDHYCKLVGLTTNGFRYLVAGTV